MRYIALTQRLVSSDSFDPAGPGLAVKECWAVTSRHCQWRSRCEWNTMRFRVYIARRKCFGAGPRGLPGTAAGRVQSAFFLTRKLIEYICLVNDACLFMNEKVIGRLFRLALYCRDTSFTERDILPLSRLYARIREARLAVRHARRVITEIPPLTLDGLPWRHRRKLDYSCAASLSQSDTRIYTLFRLVLASYWLSCLAQQVDWKFKVFQVRSSVPSLINIFLFLIKTLLFKNRDQTLFSTVTKKKEKRKNNHWSMKQTLRDSNSISFDFH